jgi:hypothetical protein
MRRDHALTSRSAALWQLQWPERAALMAFLLAL